METTRQKLTDNEIDARLAAAKAKRKAPRVYSKLPKGVKVSYFENFFNDKQRLTVVREFDKEKRFVKFGFSINHPPSSTMVVKENGPVKTVEIRREPGDVFCRKEGRQIALDRLLAKPLVTKVVGDEYPVAACLRYISDALSNNGEIETTAGAIAEDWYKEFPRRPAPSQQIVVSETKPTSFLDKIMAFFRGL